MHAAQALPMPGGRQACASGDPARRQSQGRGGRRGGAEAHRARRHVRPYPPLQPEPSVRAQAHPEGRFPHPADGRADLLFPPHQHERARPAALLDGSLALAPRRAHRRPLRISMRRAYRQSQCAPGTDPPDARHRHGHEHPVEGGQRRDLHPLAVVQQRRPARTHSSAILATARLISPATTISSPARTKRSTSARSTFP